MTNLIRELRKKKNITIEKLADLIDGTTGTLHRLETNATPLYHEYLPRLAEVLDCPILVLAGIDEPHTDKVHDECAVASSDVEPLEMANSGSEVSELMPFQLSSGGRSWRVLSNALDAIGVEKSDIITTVDIKESSPQMGDPVLISTRLAGEVGGEKRIYLRQYIEPELFITNSRANNSRVINRYVENVEIIAVLTAKILRFGR